MRGFLILSLLAAAAIATPAAARQRCEAPVPARQASPPPVLNIAPDVAAPPVPLADLAADSPWLPRFEAAADALLPAFQSRDARRWAPLLGGRWLGEGDRRAVAALLDDRCGVFRPLVEAKGPVARRILGWRIPSSYSAADRADIAARPGAEALICWSAAGRGEPQWPRTAAEADNAPGRPYGCARIAYSLRDGVPAWRAFVETPGSVAR